MTTDAANCPTQFQEYIPGSDVRVHVAGESVIATEIDSTADDYRYAARSGFEVNPSPGFTFFEAGAGQPLAAAVADLLQKL